MSENWKAIPGFNGVFEVSDLGRVRVKERTVEIFNHKAQRAIPYSYPARVLNPWLTDKGYPAVHLTYRGSSVRQTVHRLVLLTFVGEPPKGYIACHNNGIRTDCRLSKLRLDTYKSNTADTRKHGAMPLGKAIHSTKLSEDDVHAIRAALHTGVPGTALRLAREYGVTPEAISAIKIGRNWGWLKTPDTALAIKEAK